MDVTALRKLIADTARDVSAEALVPVVLDDETAQKIAEAVASRYPGVALPEMDLAPLRDPRDREWGWGPTAPAFVPWTGQAHRVTGGDGPDFHGFIAYLRGGLTRDELLPAAAFLVALHQACSQEALAETYACDCGTDGGDHEPYCASLDHPKQVQA